ncbi:MAG: hypothetical protein HUJ42_02195 [Malacoplasma sp.]|nr:hypothetical protein [Malacoplasma sp.]
MKKIIKYFSLLTFGTTNAILLTACNNQQVGFYFANFESYMSPDLLSLLGNNNTIGLNNEKIQNFNLRTFTTNEDLERNFSTNYDMGVPSTYLAVKLANSGELMVLDWKKFNLYKLDIFGNRTNEKIEKASDALTLFTPQVRGILLAYDLSEAQEYLKQNYPQEFQLYDPEGGLLNFCVPYFLQDFCFAYKSKDGNDWDFSQDSTNNAYSWNDVKNTIVSKTKTNEINKISSVDDSRSLYSISKLIQNSSLNVAANINPGDAQTGLSTTLENTISINDYENTYLYLNQDLARNTFYLNSDSNNVLNSFASLSGSDAIFSYNGDILFGTQGGDNFGYDASDSSAFASWIKNFFQDNNPNFFIKKADPTKDANAVFLLLDVMVVNRKKALQNNFSNLAYSLLYKIGLEGSDLSLYTNDSKSEYANDSIAVSDQNDQYKYGPALNFSYVQYTSPLTTLNAYVLNSASDVNSFDNSYTGVENTSLDSLLYGTVFDSLSLDLAGNGFFTNYYLQNDLVIDASDPNSKGFLSLNQYQSFINTLIKIYYIGNSVNANNTPRNISDLNKTNMSWAYEFAKDKNF